MTRDEAFALYVALEHAGYRPNLHRARGEEHEVHLIPPYRDIWEMTLLEQLIEFSKEHGYILAIENLSLKFRSAEQ